MRTLSINCRDMDSSGDKLLDGAMRLAARHIRNYTPDDWDGECESKRPKSFNVNMASYRIDEGHEVRIKFQQNMNFRKSTLEWGHVVQYVVCGMVSCEVIGKGIDQTDDLARSIVAISDDYHEVWLEVFAKDTQAFIETTRPVPVNGTVRYVPDMLTLDMSQVAVSALSMLVTNDEVCPHIMAELADNEYFGGDADFHIALTVNSTRATFRNMPDHIVKWANEYANGDTFDTYFKRIVGR